MASARLVSQVRRVPCPKPGENARVTELRQARGSLGVDIGGFCHALSAREARHLVNT